MSISSEVAKFESDWVSLEFSSVDIGDKRLDKRLNQIAKDFSEHPSQSINQSSEDWSTTKAAYRFFDNDKVSVEKIFSPHFSNTKNRMAVYEQILVVQDTTTLNFTSHKALTGLGNICSKNAVGFMQHNVLALSPEGLPLGLIDQKCWTRPEGLENKQKSKNKKRPIEEKESYRWIESLQNTHDRSPIGVEVITISDREGDFYEYHDVAESMGANCITRLKNNRELSCSDLKTKEYLQSLPSSHTYQFEVPEKKGEYLARVVTAEVRFGEITIEAPSHLKGSVANDSISMMGVYVKEINPPEGVNPVQWYLLTNCIVSDVDMALQIIAWYRLRWMVEIYHKVQKSNCKIEGCRLEEQARIQRYLALNSIISWRLLYMTYVSRVEPKSPAKSILSEIEISTLEEKCNRKKQQLAVQRKKTFRPRKIKTTRDAVRAIASLGGFLGRASDKEPGIISVARGLEALSHTVEGVMLRMQIDFERKTYG